MTAISELRARRALGEAGLDPTVPLELASSVTNDVWLSHNHVIRINTRTEHRLQREAKLGRCLPSSVGYPLVLAHGGDLGIEWLIVDRVEGVPLSRCWPTMSHDARRRAVTDLAGRLKAVHRTTCPDVGELHDVPQLLDASPFGEAATRRLMDALHQAARLPHVDPGLLHEAIVMVSESAACLEPFDSPKLIHGDLTFENILWDGEEITALLDFEWARPGPSDLDLDILLRFIAFPKLHVAADYEHMTKAEDYLPVAWWLAEDYPELFRRPNTLERLRIYSIAWDVQELLTFPPRHPREDLHEHHPLHRLHRTVRGEGHLDSLNGSSAEAIASL